MRRKFIYIMLIFPLIAWGQEERKYIRDGYKAYQDENYSEAEVNFRKAEEEKRDSYIARYNTSTALYQQNKLEESGKRFTELLQETSDPAEQARLLHNIGNVMVEGQQYQQAVEAYKRSLKLNPRDDDTRYNLAYALEKLKEQQQQEQNQDQQQQDQDQQQQDQENEQDQQQDEENNEQQQQQSDQQEDENKDQQQQQDQENEQDQQQQQSEQQDEENNEQQQQRQQQLTQEEAERLLNAILQKEKDVKEEVDKKKATTAKIKTDKDW